MMTQHRHSQIDSFIQERRRQRVVGGPKPSATATDQSIADKRAVQDLLDLAAKGTLTDQAVWSAPVQVIRTIQQMRDAIAWNWLRLAIYGGGGGALGFVVGMPVSHLFVRKPAGDYGSWMTGDRTAYEEALLKARRVGAAVGAVVGGVGGAVLYNWSFARQIRPFNEILERWEERLQAPALARPQQQTAPFPFPSLLPEQQMSAGPLP